MEKLRLNRWHDLPDLFTASPQQCPWRTWSWPCWVSRVLGTDPFVLWVTLPNQKHPQLGLSSCPGQSQVTFPFYLSKSKHEKLSLTQWEDPLSEALFGVHSLRSSSSHIRSSTWCILQRPYNVQKHQDESAFNQMCPDCVPGVMWGN